jgi:hypothetical protein
MSSGNTLYEPKLCNRSRTSEDSVVSVYNVYCVSVDILIWTCEV